MTEDEAKKEIFKLYNGKYMKHIGGLNNRDPVMGALPFYFWLQSNYPEVLTFPEDGDPYQTIACWLGRT
jgi:hypothetical protein